MKKLLFLLTTAILLCLCCEQTTFAQACGATVDPIAHPTGAPNDMGNYTAANDGSDNASYTQAPPNGSLPNDSYVIEVNGVLVDINEDASFDASTLNVGDVVTVTGFTYDLDSINSILNTANGLCPTLDALFPELAPCGLIGQLVNGDNDGSPGLDNLQEALDFAGSFGSPVESVDTAVAVLNSLNETISILSLTVCFQISNSYEVTIVEAAAPPMDEFPCGAIVADISAPAGTLTDVTGANIVCANGPYDAYIQPSPAPGSLPDNDYVVELNGIIVDINSNGNFGTLTNTIAGDVITVTGFTYDLDSINSILTTADGLCPGLDVLFPDLQPCDLIGQLVSGANDGVPGLNNLQEALDFAGSFGSPITSVDSAVAVLLSLNETISLLGLTVCFATSNSYDVNVVSCDCAGVPNGSATVDDCGVCNGDGSSCEEDCAGVPGGSATLDDCGVCEGDNSTCTDCAGVVNGTSVVDECGVCDGDNSTCTDCAGVVNGTSVEDACGVCDGDGSSCTDCEGVPGGSATLDDCGVCNGDNSTCADCAGVPNGTSVLDDCGVCDGDNSTCTDCAGVVNGTSVLDDCGVCDGDNSTCTDCAGVVNGTSVVDACGVCGGDGSSCGDNDGDGLTAENDPDDNDPCNPDNTVGACDSDGDGTPDGNDCAPDDASAATVDACGVCGGDGSSCGDNDGDGLTGANDPDDNDPCNPDNTVGACDSDGDGTPDGLDCAPDDASAATVDACDVCGGDGTSCVEQDADGDGVGSDTDPDDNDPCNPDNTVGACDSDGDGTPDGLDCAPDDAAIAMMDACGVCGGDGSSCDDNDGDGLTGADDPDDNDPCNPDNTVGACDSDGDGTPDGLDCAPDDASAATVDACDVCGGDGTSCQEQDADGDGVGSDTDPDDNDPCNPDSSGADCDTDGDGTPNGMDCAPDDASAATVDACDVCGGDGTSCIEQDADGDGFLSDVDPDDNDPCNPDSSGADCDSDGDGTPNGMDCAPDDASVAMADACGVCGGDGSSCTDNDGDGVTADNDPDDNDPCNPNNAGADCDSDGDGTPNGMDCAPNDASAATVDACGICGGDGASCADNDGDGLTGADDPDDNDACNPDNTIGACDSDGDGTPDGLDCAPNDPNAVTLDACGVCGGDNSTCLDCAGIPNGPNAVDACGICGGDGTSCTDNDGDGVPTNADSDDNDPCVPNTINSACNPGTPDCAGVLDGPNTLDACGVCDDDSSNDNQTCADCAGFPNGSSTVDDCGVCDADPSNDNSTCLDCAGVPNGSSTVDDCGVCDDNAANDNSTCADCLAFQAASGLICGGELNIYTIIFSFVGDQTGDGYGLTNNQTGETEFTTASSLTTGFFATGTGYSFTAFLASNPDCSYDFNSTVVDCNVTAIELLSFEGEVTEAGNLISWTTATETNSSHFTVQRSIDGNNFRSINETTAKGNNTIQDYKFLDSEATEGVYFYRLLETDKDGATNIVSSVIRLENKTTHFEVISVGPVPVSDYLNIDYVSNQTEEIQYEIYDITGQLLTSEMIQANEGENEIKINLSNYPAGTYFLKLNNAERQLNVSKFIRE